jgi:hypothetical protein
MGQMLVVLVIVGVAVALALLVARLHGGKIPRMYICPAERSCAAALSFGTEETT